MHRYVKMPIAVESGLSKLTRNYIRVVIEQVFFSLPEDSLVVQFPKRGLACCCRSSRRFIESGKIINKVKMC